jgi:hypothetical protein
VVNEVRDSGVKVAGLRSERAMAATDTAADFKQVFGCLFQGIGR